MIYRAVILVSLTAAILFVGGLTAYPKIAVREEFDLAKGRSIAEAFELFFARHPDHALVGAARA